MNKQGKRETVRGNGSSSCSEEMEGHERQSLRGWRKWARCADNCDCEEEAE